MSIRTDGATAAVTATLALAAAAWLATVRQMRGMDMGVSTDLGSFAFFVGVWVPKRCRENVRSGLRFGLYCVGSSVGLMATLIALGAMSVTWMVVVVVVVLAQKLLRPRPSIDLPLALAIVGLGVVTSTM